MPSMPLEIWGDEDGRRYHDAYFDTYPGVWRHGDWLTVTSRGTCVIHGRSDSTLNRHGVRMGSSDIYQAVEALPEVAEALVLGIEQADGPASTTMIRRSALVLEVNGVRHPLTPPGLLIGRGS